MTGAFFPFFLHSLFAGLVPPFSRFFFAILDHYQIHALHLQPNSVFLLSVFAFYCEAFVGVKPSIALFRHFFSLRTHGSRERSGCVSFVALNDNNELMKAGKKVDAFRRRWIYLDAQSHHALLELPTGRS